ncbi:MAG: MlaD family protein [Nitrospiraceae bacterium]|nr:MlaD family protein [Nitrospiraceae bacterium]
MKETDPRFINLGRKAVLFFAIAVIGIIATLIFIGMESGIFTKTFRIHLTVEKGTGFFEGMPVKLSGFKIGKIQELSLDENAKVKVVLTINKKYQKWIRQDSKALLGKEGLIGESIIAITVGSMDKPIIQNDSSIQFEKGKGVEEILEEVKPLIGEIKNILVYINDPQGDLKKTISNLKTLSSGLLNTRANVDKAISNITPAMAKLDRTMDNLEKTTAKLKDAVDKSSPKIPAVMSKTEDALDGTDEVVRSLKQIWPIRLFIEEPKNKQIYGDSYE